MSDDTRYGDSKLFVEQSDEIARLHSQLAAATLKADTQAKEIDYLTRELAAATKRAEEAEAANAALSEADGKMIDELRHERNVRQKITAQLADELAAAEASCAGMRSALSDLLKGCEWLDREQSVLPQQMQRARQALSSVPQRAEAMGKVIEAAKRLTNGTGALALLDGAKSDE